MSATRLCKGLGCPAIAPPLVSCRHLFVGNILGVFVSLSQKRQLVLLNLKLSARLEACQGVEALKASHCQLCHVVCCLCCLLPSSAVAAAGTRFYHASCINPPAAPSEPSGTFTGTLIRAGSGGDYSTLSAAVAAASPGDRIQVLTGTITETSVVSITKSLEIFGTGSSCIVRRDSSGSVGGPVISINANNVYVHDLAVVNMHVPSTDSGGQSSCITAATMTETPLNINGADGIYITRCAFTYPKFGVSIDAAG